MGGKFSRDKGARSERELVNMLKGWGYEAKRVPLSGAAEGFKGDVLFRRPGDPVWQTIEAKVRANGFKQIYEWLPDDGFLCLKRDRDEWLVVMRLSKLHEELEGDKDGSKAQV